MLHPAPCCRRLCELANRLVGLGIERVVMEATSDYWRPPFYLFEAHGLAPWLVNAKDLKHFPGRPKLTSLCTASTPANTGRVAAPNRSRACQPTVHRPKLNLSSRVGVGVSILQIG